MRIFWRFLLTVFFCVLTFYVGVFVVDYAADINSVAAWVLEILRMK